MSKVHMLAKLALAIALVPMSAAFAYDPSATPSTNDDNRDNGWAHVNQVDVGDDFVLGGRPARRA
jgi:hypothetical protein